MMLGTTDIKYKYMPCYRLETNPFPPGTKPAVQKPYRLLLSGYLMK